MPHRSAADPELATPPAEALARFRDGIGRLIDPAADRLLVAVSGGPDSLALLLMAAELFGDRCLAATVDHRLRPESADEAAFVAALCHERGIAHQVLADDLPARVRGSDNLSQRARTLRYRLLRELAASWGGAWIATAHHADDQVETLVMRLNRGAGVAGLSGIREKADGVIRPLLDWCRAELAEVVRACRVTAIDDPTNRDDRFDRARLRKALKGADWLDPGHIVTSARALGEAEDALVWATERLAGERIGGGADGPVLDTAGLPPELVRRLVLRCLALVEHERDHSGPALVRLIARLLSGEAAMIGDVLVSPQGADGSLWRFRPAPPRRSA